MPCHYQVAKHMTSTDGARIFEGLLTGKNEFGEIRLQQFVQSTATEQFRNSLEQLCVTGKILNYDPLLLVYVDNCCQVRTTLESAMPALQDGLSCPPTLELTSDPIYITERKAATIAASAIYEEMIARQPADAIIGLDLEWDFTMDSNAGGKAGKIAMLQIAMPGGNIHRRDMCVCVFNFTDTNLNRQSVPF